MRDGLEAVVALCGRMPALTSLDREGASSLTDEALRAAAEQQPLTHLNLTQMLASDGIRECRRWLGSSA